MEGALTQPVRNLLNQNPYNKSSKRSCQYNFEHDNVFAVLNKVKPAAHSMILQPVTFKEDPSAPVIYTQPAFLPYITSSPVTHTVSKSGVLEKPDYSSGDTTATKDLPATS